MAGNKHWVGTWAAAPAPAEGVVGFNNHTLRMNPRISIGGDRLRVRISNAYGNRPLPIRAAGWISIPVTARVSIETRRGSSGTPAPASPWATR